MICKECTLCTIEQFHSICASSDGDLINTVPQIESDNCQNVDTWLDALHSLTYHRYSSFKYH